MALLEKLAKFGLGVATGGAIGAAIGTLTAPADGETFRYRLHKHFADAKTAGDTAKVAKQTELIQRYREDVGDSTAMDDEVPPPMSRADAVMAMGLGLNAPGAIAARQAADPENDD
jgi:gas vesicle protein